MISVIVAIYNIEKYVKKCIESLLNQDIDTEYEIIAVDDGSSDSSLKILNEFKNERLVIYSKENGGQASARNFGIQRANGNYIVFVDGDDYVRNDYLSSLYNQVKNTTQSIGIVNYTRKKFDNKLKKSREINSEKALKLLFNDKIIHSHVWGKIFHIDVVKDLFMPEGVYYEDMMIIHKYFMRAKHISVSKSKTYFYRKNTSGVMNSKLSSKKITDMRLYNSNICNEVDQKYMKYVSNRIYINCLLLLKASSKQNDAELQSEVSYVRKHFFKIIFSNVSMKVKVASLISIINWRILRRF